MGVATEGMECLHLRIPVKPSIFSFGLPFKRHRTGVKKGGLKEVAVCRSLPSE